jgi:very-short-patch-repair endonuclease
METICKHCSELIMLIGRHWIHLKSDKHRCELPAVAEPVDYITLPREEENATYLRGVMDGRRATHIQEKKTNRWHSQSTPLNAASQAIIARFVTERLEDTERLEASCESPMEQLFAMAIIIDADLHYNLASSLWDGDGIFMQTQRAIKGYRVDFTFWDRLVVEIDGHDFHDRDQEQASGDRKRDREILRAGFTVMRFTGSDVYRNAHDCAAEVKWFLGKRI